MQQWITMTTNEHDNLDSKIFFLKPLFEAFKFIYILKIIQVMKV